GEVTTGASPTRPAPTRECWPGGASAMAHLLAYARAIRETTAGTFLATPASSTASKTMMHPEILATDLAFGESPRWHGDRLWVADWGDQNIVTIDRHGAKTVCVRLRFPSFQPICFDWLPDGHLLVVSSRDAALLRKDPARPLMTYADLGNIARGFNEIVVDGRGNAYVNGSSFDLMAGEKFVPGVIALVTPDGAARHVADGLAFPNGMAVTPDNATLIVAESYGKKLTAFTIAADGSLSNRR